MSTPEDAPWSKDLTAGVHALASAAWKYRAAAGASRAATRITDTAQPVEGSVAVPGNDHIRPHSDALWRFGQLYGELRRRSQELYENAAEAYAFGAAQALTAALNGERSTHVELRRSDGLYVLPEQPLPDFDSLLTACPESHRLARLRLCLEEHRRARRLTRSYADCYDLADTQPAAMVRRQAGGLADCAYAYGESAEALLHRALPTHPPESA